MKRVLLAAEDQLIVNYHRVRLEELGLRVDVARSAACARRLAKERAPDLALVDPIMAAESPTDVVETLRNVLEERPLWVISKMPKPVAAVLQKAGAARLVERDGNPGESVFAKTAEALGPGPRPPEPDAEKERAWVRMVADAAAGTINAARVTLHDFVRDPRRGADLYELFRQVHVLSHRASMLGLAGQERMIEALDTLVYDLYAMPEQINPSVVRTVSQALDFLVSLLGAEEAVADPAGNAAVCVVEDEAGARQMIGAAMKLVELRMACAEDHAGALEVLERSRFDLIFLDVNLPSGPGFELCGKVRALEEHRHTPIVFLTGMNTLQNRAKGSLCGGNDFVGKPFNLLELGVKALMWILKGRLGLVDRETVVVAG